MCFVVKLRTNPLTKSAMHKLNLRLILHGLIYNKKDATFENLLERGKSRTILEDNMHKLNYSSKFTNQYILLAHQ